QEGLEIGRRRIEETRTDALPGGRSHRIERFAAAVELVRAAGIIVDEVGLSGGGSRHPIATGQGRRGRAALQVDAAAEIDAEGTCLPVPALDHHHVVPGRRVVERDATLAVRETGPGAEIVRGEYEGIEST